MGIIALVISSIVLLQFINCDVLPTTENQNEQDSQNRVILAEADKILENLRKLQSAKKERDSEKLKRRCDTCRESFRCKTQGKCECSRFCKDVDGSTILPPISGESTLGARNNFKRNDIPRLLEKPGRFYTVGLFEPGPKQDLLARLLNITRKDNLDKLLLLAKAKAVNTTGDSFSTKPIIIDTANIFGEGKIQPQIYKIDAKDKTEPGIELADKIERKLNLEMQSAHKNRLTEEQVNRIISEALKDDKVEENSDMPNNTIDTTHITTKRSVNDVEVIPNAENLNQPARENLQDTIPTKFESRQRQAREPEFASKHLQTENNDNQSEDAGEIVTSIHQVDNTPDQVGAINPSIMDETIPFNKENTNNDIVDNNFKIIRNAAKDGQGLLDNSQLNASKISLILQNLEKQVENVADLVKKTCGKVSNSEVLGQSVPTNDVDIAKPKSSISQNSSSSKALGDLQPNLNAAIHELEKDTELAIDDAKNLVEKLNTSLLEELETKVADNLADQNCKNGMGCVNKQDEVPIHSRSNFEKDLATPVNNVNKETGFIPEEIDSEAGSPQKRKDLIQPTIATGSEEGGLIPIEAEPQLRKSPEQNVNINWKHEGNTQDIEGDSNNEGTEMQQTPKNTDTNQDNTILEHPSQHAIKNIKQNQLEQHDPLQNLQSTAANRETSPNQEIYITLSPNDNGNTEVNQPSVDSHSKDSLAIQDPVPTDKKDTVGCSQEEEGEIVPLYQFPQYRTAAENKAKPIAMAPETSKSAAANREEPQTQQFDFIEEPESSENAHGAQSNVLLPEILKAVDVNTEAPQNQKLSFTEEPQIIKETQLDKLNTNLHHIVSPQFNESFVPNVASKNGKPTEESVLIYDKLKPVDFKTEEQTPNRDSPNNTEKSQPTDKIQTEQPNSNTQHSSSKSDVNNAQSDSGKLTDVVGCSNEDDEIIYVNPISPYREASDDNKSDNSNKKLQQSQALIDSNNNLESVNTNEEMLERQQLQLTESPKIAASGTSNIGSDPKQLDKDTVGCSKEEESEIMALYPIPQYRETNTNDAPQFATKDVKPNVPLKLEQSPNEKKAAAANRQTPSNHEFNIPADANQSEPQKNVDLQHVVIPFQENISTDQETHPSFQQRFKESDGSDVTRQDSAQKPILSVVGSSKEATPSVQEDIPNPLTLFGRIVPQINNTELAFKNLPNNKFVFMGNGMQLPLKLKQGKDGSLQLSVDIDSLCTTCTKETCKHYDNTNTQNLSQVRKRSVKKPIMNRITMPHDTELENRQSELSKRSLNFRLPLPLLSRPASISENSHEDDFSNKRPLAKNLRKINKNMKTYSEKRLRLEKEYKERNRQALEDSSEIKNMPQRRALLLNNVLNWVKDLTVKN